jgi:transposase
MVASILLWPQVATAAWSSARPLPLVSNLSAHFLIAHPDPSRVTVGVDTHGEVHVACAKLALRQLGQRYQALDAELAMVDAELDRLTALAAPGLRQLCGVGPEIAGALLVAAGDNPERLHSEAAFSMLCGASPIPASSGKTVRHRLNRGGNRQANTALTDAV